MLRNVLAATAVMVVCVEVQADGAAKQKIARKIEARQKAGDNPGKEADKFNKVEGAVWQYTMTEPDSKEERKGKFRLDGKAIFKGDKRIGDVKPQSKEEMQLVFTDFEQLKGQAKLKLKSPGIYVGAFRDKETDVTWKFELRRSQD